MDNTDAPYKDKVRELFSSDGDVHYYSATPDAIVNLAKTGELVAEPAFHVFESDIFGKLKRVSSGDISDYLQEDPAAIMSKQHMRSMRLLPYVIEGLSLQALINIVKTKAWSQGPLVQLLYEAIMTGGSKNLFRQLEQEGISKGQFRRALRRAVEEHDVPMMTMSFEPEIYEAFDFVNETGENLGYFKTDKIPIQYINHINYLRRDEWQRLTPEQKEIIPRNDYPAIAYRCEESGLTDRLFLDFYCTQASAISNFSAAQLNTMRNKSASGGFMPVFEMILKSYDKLPPASSTIIRLFSDPDFGSSPLKVMDYIQRHIISCAGCRKASEEAHRFAYDQKESPTNLL